MEVVEELVPGFKVNTVFQLHTMEHLVIEAWRNQLTMVEIKRVRDVFQEACLWIKKKAVPTVDLAARALFTCDSFWKKCQPGPLLLLLKCLVACASEAIIESYGSVMETMFQRYTCYTDNDDGRCQREMFTKICAPKVPTNISWRLFLKDAVHQYSIDHQGCTFAHEGKVINRMPITSKTVERLETELLSDTNRVAGLSCW